MFRTVHSATTLWVLLLQASTIAFGEDPLTRVIMTSRKFEKTGDLRAAVQILGASLAVPENNSNPAVLAIALNDLGSLYVDAGRLSESEKPLQRSIRLFERLYAPGCAEAQTPLSNLARVYAAQGNLSRAQNILEQMLVTRLATLGELHPKVAITLNNLANVYFVRGRTSDAERYARRAISALEPSPGQHPLELASARSIIALVKATSGGWRDAIEEIRRAVITIEDNFTPEYPGVLPYLLNLASFHIELREWHAAETVLNCALSIFELRLPQKHPHRAGALNLLAKVYRETGRRAEAKRASKTAEAIVASQQRENSLDHLVSVDALRQRR